MSSYLVLARKYRPQTFADLVGQEQVSRTLKNALATGRVAHAYLFSGPRGVGKTTAARLLAMALSCLDPDVAARPCGYCESCLEIQSGQAVDVIEVDGASNRGINEIRDLRETVKYLPAKSRYKVYIIDEVHALTSDAFNALLKTLEEPPAHVVFIFATTETHKVLPTILSRCQRYDFRRIRVDDIVGRLAQVAELEGIEAEPAALEMIARQAEGGLRDSLSLMDQVIAAGGGKVLAAEVESSLGLIDQNIVRGILTHSLAGEAAPGLQLLEDAYLRGYDFKDMGQKLLEAARCLALIKVSPGNAELMDLTETEGKFFAAEAQKHSLESIQRHFEAWLKFQAELNRHPQPRWLMEAQVIRLSQLAPLMPLAELAARLSNLLAKNPAPPRPAASASAPAAPAAVAAAPRADYVPGSPAAPYAPAARSEAAAAAAEDETEDAPAGGRVASWADFWRVYNKRIDETVKALMEGAGAAVFNAGEVAIVFKRPVTIGEGMRSLIETRLMGLLEEALGGRPKLTFSSPAAPEPENAGGNWKAEKLAEVKAAPEIQQLMARLPGEFVDYRAAEKIAAEPEERDDADETAADYSAAPEDDEPDE